MAGNVGIDVVLSFGSNCGDRVDNVMKAMQWACALLHCSRKSHVYETPPVGHAGSNYMNSVMTGFFKGGLSELDEACKDYEIACGRNEVSRGKGEVPIDIDIVIALGKVLRPKDFSREFFQIGYRQLSPKDK